MYSWVRKRLLTKK